MGYAQTAWSLSSWVVRLVKYLSLEDQWLLELQGVYEVNSSIKVCSRVGLFGEKCMRGTLYG